ncbi:Sulfoxide reductase catalytic subunit YedY precursor [Maioricimonas rarisocia]|uniref:Sulfoxide reductase catalytic subunit YedY n=1 Tax=Maioricimonas rarisocia TaxID=2528026 RepID=A0A517Z4B3_9PLAN|nr:sulfite oxidase-like oxidoreductase [Maioricimonas rarisocia]QDU37321.1 Sulfoxide reductase catalytic subunit YedY precursor [Maioricimonas rarisocia]
MSVEQDPKYQTGEPATPANLPQDVIVSPDTRRDQRIPPGQTRTKKWPVLHYGHVPFIDRDKWRLEITGLVERPLRFNWDEFRQLPRVKVFSDFHCVTRWSRLGNLWEGVATRHLMELAGIRPDATHVVAQGYDSGWTTNLPLDEFLAEDALLVDLHDGQPLDADHGGPVRLVVPQLYAWKSAKWLKKIELVDQDQPGYWEQLGYHDHGDPWTEERFRDELGRRPDPE